MLPIQPNPLPSAQPETGTGTNQRNKQRGTGFTNINRVLGANQGAGEKMGQAIGGNLTNQAGQVKEGVQQGQSTFQVGMQQGAQGAQSAIQQGAQLKQATGETPEAYAARLAQANSTQLATQGQGLQNAAYTGPKGLDNAGQIQSRAATVGALGRLAGSNAGQGQLLRSQVAQHGNYTQGQNALDQLLLGKEGQSAIQQGRQATTGVAQQAQNSVQNAQTQAQAQDAAINTNKTKVLQDLQNQLSGNGEGGPKGFTQLAKDQAASYNKNAARIQQLLAGKNEDGSTMTSANVTAEDRALLNNMDQYGLDSNASIYGKNMDEYGNFLSQMGSNLDVSQNARYLGDQGAAAQNLAKFLGDSSTANQVAGTNFNNNVFNKGQQEETAGRNAALEQSDIQSRDRLAQQAALKDQLDTFLYNAAHPLGSGVNAAKRVNSDMEQVQRLTNQMQSLGMNPQEAAASLRDQAGKLQGQKKSLKQLALERLGQS